ncbi:MAG: 23S rRNA (uracil(1939)-C(5))-methyltransferase RlmD, partial [Oscillospiraceae bacterium]|nr:23S rRNA (uracil(1939)-C(5))-methyltransferase RlmD [Oscillospiraceae bacterium]
MELKKNEILKVKIDGCSGDGSGIARVNGLVVFVKGALRDETCAIRILKVRKSMAFARVERVITASPMRRPPACPHFGICGGCAFWHMDYQEELEIKRLHVEDTLKRIGGLALPVPVILGADAILKYRNKAQYPVSSGPEGVKIGFYRTRSHDVRQIDHCLIVNDAANAAAKAVRRWMTDACIPAYEEKTGTGLIRHVFVRTNHLGESLICLVANGEQLPKKDMLIALLRQACPSCSGILLSVNRAPGNVILGKQFKLLWGKHYLTDQLFGLRFNLSVPSFYQVNREQTLRLYETAMQYAALTGHETVLDLYCGTGTISLFMARRAGRVIGVEIVPEAIRDAKKNAASNSIQNVSFYCGDSGTAAKALRAEGLQPDVIIVDPPRKGLGPQALDEIA